MSNIMEKLELTAQSMYCKKIEELTASELHLALGKAVMGEIAPNWAKSKAKHNSERRAYYMSAEFLMGRMMYNNLYCLGILDEVKKLLKDVLKKHRRIIFNGDGYSPEWVKEAERRGLPNYPSTVDCMPHYTDEKNLRILRKFGIFNREELTARTEIHLEKYSKTRRIEARTMIEMSRKQLLPASLEYLDTLCTAIANKKAIGLTAKTEEKIAAKLNDLCDRFYESIERLEKQLETACAIDDVLKQAKYFHDYVLAEMNIMRSIADEIEINMPLRYWPIPTYSEIIYNV